jgi:hypothetical protein
MNASPQPMSPVEQEVVELLDEHAAGGVSAFATEAAPSFELPVLPSSSPIHVAEPEKTKEELTSMTKQEREKYWDSRRRLLGLASRKKGPRPSPSNSSILSSASALSSSTSESLHGARSPTADAKPSVRERCRLTVVNFEEKEDESGRGDKSTRRKILRCEVLVKLRPLCTGDVIQNEQGARAKVKSMVTLVGQEWRKIEKAEVKTPCDRVCITLGPCEEGCDELNASMLTRGVTELRSAISLNAEEGKEHLLWYKVAKSDC